MLYLSFIVPYNKVIANELSEMKKEAINIEHNIRLYIKGNKGSTGGFISTKENKPGVVREYQKQAQKRRREEEEAKLATSSLSQSSVIATQSSAAESSYVDEEESSDEVLDDSEDEDDSEED
jgi:hypothetical protein